MGGILKSVNFFFIRTVYQEVRQVISDLLEMYVAGQIL